jgi:hypothetical protein
VPFLAGKVSKSASKLLHYLELISLLGVQPAAAYELMHRLYGEACRDFHIEVSSEHSRNDGQHDNTGEELVFLPLCPSQIPHGYPGIKPGSPLLEECISSETCKDNSIT